MLAWMTLLDNNVVQVMSKLNPQNPEKFVPLTFPENGRVIHVYKRFDDPDFIELYLGAKKTFEVTWATNANSTQSVDLISELTNQAEFNKGTIALTHTFRRPDTVMGGTNFLEGPPEDIINEVRDSGARAVGYTLHSKNITLAFRPTWPKTYHDIASNEFVLTLGRRNPMARFVLDQTISLTGMDGVRGSIDKTLDEFAEFVPVLRT